jgi:large subunit ribosomal protein L4e
MKSRILDIAGKEKGSIELPKEFSAVIRDDIVSRVLEAKKRQHPYSPSPVAGKQHSAKGLIVHRRHVWRSGYGRGQSRVPRKIFSGRGSQFNWEAAEVPFARGGMRAHPPKIEHFLKELKINKKEFKIAFISALAATANEKYVSKKYSRLEDKKVKVPFVVEGKIAELKIKAVLKSLKDILGNETYEVAIKKRAIRAGRGKMRGRKYKSNAGMLLVLGNNEKLKTNMFDVVQAHELTLWNLSNGGLGRLTVYTENAIKDIEKKLKGKLNTEENKK